MHKDTVKGSAKEAGGVLKKKAGQATGDVNMEADGAAREAEGKVQKGVGKVKEGVRDVLKR